MSKEKEERIPKILMFKIKAMRKNLEELLKSANKIETETREKIKKILEE